MSNKPRETTRFELGGVITATKNFSGQILNPPREEKIEISKGTSGTIKARYTNEFPVYEVEFKIRSKVVWVKTPEDCIKIKKGRKKTTVFTLVYPRSAAE